MEIFITTLECASAEKPSPPNSFGMIMPMKPWLFDEAPDFGRQVHQLVADFPVVEHGAKFFDRAVEERLLFRGQLRLGKCAQLLPIGVAGKKLGVPPHRAGIDGLALGRPTSAAARGDTRPAAVC